MPKKTDLPDQRDEAIELAQLRANQSGQGYYVHLETERDKDGTAVALVYHVTRNDLTPLDHWELIAHRAPE